MRHILISCLFILIILETADAQIRATTEDGEKVLLFDNGTWKVDDRSAVSTEKAIGAGVIAATTITIDTTREIKTDFKELFYLPSDRLVRFFGDNGSNIRCKMSCSNNLGDIKIHFQWEFPVSDGDRYFGWFKKGSTVTYEMEDDQKVEIVMGNENGIKRFEKNNYSMIHNSSIPLTEAQLQVLASQPFEKVTVGWKKKPEEYDVDSSDMLMKELPSVF